MSQRRKHSTKFVFGFYLSASTLRVARMAVGVCDQRTTKIIREVTISPIYLYCTHPFIGSRQFWPVSSLYIHIHDAKFQLNRFKGLWSLMKPIIVFLNDSRHRLITCYTMMKRIHPFHATRSAGRRHTTTSVSRTSRLLYMRR